MALTYTVWRILFDVAIDGDPGPLGLGTAPVITANLPIGFTVSTVTFD
jgi:hypothetical protein